MLVISRKKNETIVINDEISVVVVEIRGDKVRLGVTAPPEVSVHRSEVWAAIHRRYDEFPPAPPPPAPPPPASARPIVHG